MTHVTTLVPADDDHPKKFGVTCVCGWAATGGPWVAKRARFVAFLHRVSAGGDDVDNSPA